MAGIENVRAVRTDTSTDRWLDEQTRDEPPKRKLHALDSPGKQKLHTKLYEWYQQERERQAPNRYQMALDHDYYDNLQWAEDDAQDVRARGQAPLVYNETAPTVDWIVGTEKRTRVDFKVLPRTEDDVNEAKAKTDVLKWMGDINKTPFHRSASFADAVKGGLGWLEDSVRGDPDEEPIYSRYESWKNMLHDSLGVERDGSDWRYVFRLKWLDLDVAEAMFPDRKAELRRAAISTDFLGSEEDEDYWYLGQHYQARDEQGQAIGRRTFVSDAALVNNRRARVKIIECWYRVPRRCNIMRGEVYNGERFDMKNAEHRRAVKDGAVSVYDCVQMEVRCAVMTEGHLLQDMKSPFKHNRFPFTPVWCYRRTRDGQAYGIIRRIRDPQDDLNKRGSKALFLLSTNRVIADTDAVEDHDEAREEAARPDAYIIKKRGAEFRIENNDRLANEHLMLMDRNARLIRQSGGVTDDNLGRQTNAISGEAIKARQLQGSVVTAEIFDNLRLAVQLQGEIQLSLAEQFITQAKMVRLTGARGELRWTQINKPEQDATGQWRYVNDITARHADFVVDQQDFHQSTRQAMFATMVDLVGRISAINPEAGLRILKMTLEFSDLPNKDDMAAEIAEMLGLEETNKDPATMTPAEREKFEARQTAKQEQAARARAASDLQMKAAAAQTAKVETEAEKNRALTGKAEAETAQIVFMLKTGMEQLAEQVNTLTEMVGRALTPQPQGAA